MLNDYVRSGIKLGVKDINLGRTTSEIKSILGAMLEYLCCYTKHYKKITNSILKSIIKQIKMIDFKQHTPFRKGII